MARRLVSLCLVVSLLLLGWYVRLAVGSAGAGSAARVLLGLLASIAPPYALALGLLLLGRRARAVTLAGGTALVVLVPLAPFVTLTVVFMGVANREQLTAILVSVVFVLVQVLMLGAAVVAHRALPAGERRGGAWALGIAAPLTYAIVWFGAARGSTLSLEQRRQSVRENERAARETVRTVRGCLERYADAHPEHGFPTGLALLEPSAVGCSAAGLTAEQRGYHVSYVPGVPDARGVIRLFSLYAEPFRVGRTGWTTFTLDESGSSAEAYPTEQDGGSAVPYAAAWSRAEVLRAHKHCLVRYAAEHPALGYPTDLQLAAEGCPAAGAFHTSEAGVSAFSGDDRYSYRPGARDEHGLIRTFELRRDARSGTSLHSLLLDETGAVHEAEGREATRTDPAPEVGEERRCRADGSNDACLALAAKVDGGQGVRADPARALALYELACGRGDVSGCLAGGSLLDRSPDLSADPNRKAALFKRACDLGDPRGCESWKLAAAPSAPSP